MTAADHDTVTRAGRAAMRAYLQRGEVRLSTIRHFLRRPHRGGH
ncbi:MAG: hypothetical protein Q7V57_19265 [Actinomycetota bacterium]|nr:hypothetical protein [Actinomycetota bacterium]